MKYLAFVALLAFLGVASADLRENLIAHGEVILKHAQEGVHYLESHQRIHEAQELKKEEAVVHKLIAELKATTDTAHVKTLEKELAAAEARIVQELRKIHKSSNDHNPLIGQAEELKSEIQKEIEKLNSEGRQKFTRNLDTLEKYVDDLIHRANTTTNHHELNHLAREFVILRGQFHRERNELERAVNSVDVLVKKAEALEFNIKKDIELLVARNYSDAAEILRIDAQRLELLARDLKNETELEALRYLETELRAIENSVEIKLHRIEHELEKPHHVRAKRDIRDDLRKQSQALLERIREEIAKLEKAGKHKLAVGLEDIEKFVLDIDTQLHNLNPHTWLGKEALKVIEGLLHRGETMLEDALKKIDDQENNDHN